MNTIRSFFGCFNPAADFDNMSIASRGRQTGSRQNNEEITLESDGTLVATRTPGKESFFCTLPAELIANIFGTLSDRDVVSALLVSKDVNLAVNRSLEPRIRASIYQILLQAGGFSIRNSVPLKQLKSDARLAKEKIRLRVKEQQERLHTERVFNEYRERQRQTHNKRMDNVMACSLMGGVVTACAISFPAVVNCLSDEQIRSGPLFKGTGSEPTFDF